MLQKIKKFIEKEGLLQSGDKLIVGLSGGADSVVLLYVLHRLGYNCLAAHCNFHLRSEEADRDEQFTETFAQNRHIPFFKKDFDTSSVAKERAVSIEMAARDLRYEWFEKLRKKEKAAAIVVAHHQDDSIETLLLNLIRGTGIKGLTGIKPRNGFVVRPLLCVSKTEILLYAGTEKLPFVTDSTNKQDEFTRNKIRLQVIPLLKTLNPSVNEALIQTMNNLNEAAKIYEAEIEKALQSVWDKEKNSIDIPALKNFPSSETILFELLKKFGFGKEVIADIHKAIDAQPGKVFYSPTHRLVKDRDAFLLSRFETHHETETSYLIQPETNILEMPFLMEISCIDNDNNQEIDKQRHIAHLDRDKLQFPLLLRKWLPGDKFIPYGMKGFQKLSDFFNNHKISMPEKENAWVLTSGKDIIWLVNYRIDSRFGISEHTRKKIIIKLF
jgi:tRNA(Ile)-lysidine synthase